MLESPPDVPEERKPLLGTPVESRCGVCHGDLSDHAFFFQIAQPVMAGPGQLAFQPQVVIVNPLRCPHCGEPQLRQQRVIPAGAI